LKSCWRFLTRPVIYCSHEYTIANAAFARSVDPDNAALAARQEAIAELRENGLPTVPTRLDLEKATNPFLRVEDADYPRASWLWKQPAMPQVLPKSANAKIIFSKDRFC
jgi:hydroxyacylglutathione hydrolase